MDTMDEIDDRVEMEPRKTRSGRKTPAVETKKTPRKSRKKVELELSDDDSKMMTISPKPIADSSDNAVEAEDIQDNVNQTFEDSNSATNDFNSFQATESYLNSENDSNSGLNIVQNENGQEEIEDLMASDTNDSEKMQSIEKMDTDSEESNMVNMLEADMQESTMTDVNDQSLEKREDIKQIVVDPDAENISEDELPTVQAVKVPETEEVSDEELPGPKRAELPADTEVVSEEELESVKKENNKRKIQEDNYDPGSPTSECESAPKKPALESSEETDDKDKAKKLPELDKYWKAVNDDPADFTGWTYLLQYVDQENDMEAAREAYDAFLSHYPYCYGYWRKYADYEKRKGNKKKCEEVFERGLKAIPLSVDLWIHYLTYVRTAKIDDEDFVRAQFERSLKACGLEFRSDRLWENYIKWEIEGKRLQFATLVYERLLATPTQGYLQHFDNFQEHVASNPANKILEVDEFLALRKEVKNLLKQDAADIADNPDIPPGEDTEENTDEETKAIRERIVSIRRKIHKNTSTAVTNRWNFEEGIKRPYFHVKPLERCQLKNWQEYLDYEIAQGDEARIIVLFERCLIACALYEEFWLRFVHYLQSLKKDEFLGKIKDIFERACTIHHLKKPNIHMQWAMFEESIKNFNKAAEILQNLDKTVPNLLQVAYRRINLERRRGDNDKCCQLYEHYINNSKNKVISTNLAIKYSRFILKILCDIEKSIEVIKNAITKDANNPRLYLQLIDVTIHKEGLCEEEILKIIDSFLTKDSTDVDQKVMFAQRKFEFLEDFGSNIECVQKAYEEYQKLATRSKENKKKGENKDVSKKDKNAASTTSSASYNNYGNYSNSTNSYQYGNSQQGTYGQYPQYNQGDQYQYGNWQYQGNYSGYSQWGGYGSGYSY
ncbi:PREDICTED: pre-mRNA-processing factor 39 [Nicrophorus vespilloides]|uniref:Pre-mRNA-processing factor 39 n=1 Tax=Nicrophorus vespilloides TaxID=110193 RepID=A0ABM1NB67_NICVS|nr:PREDICTED: pre-mRNA-processing factor 39 [Nicrophorus vespilloides]